MEMIYINARFKQIKDKRIIQKFRTLRYADFQPKTFNDFFS